MHKTIIKFVFIILTLTSFVNGQEYHGLFVGINDYPGTINDLTDCVNDATHIRNRLITYKNWPSGDCELLTDTDADETTILDKIDDLPKGIYNRRIVSISSHGDSQELSGSDGIIPANSIYARITPSELENKFGSNNNLFACYIDNCGSGVFVDDMSYGVISSACRANEYAQENYNNHGYYSYFIIQAIQQTSITTAEAIHNYAAPRVTAAISSMHPQLSDNFYGNLDIYRNPTPNTPHIEISGGAGDNPTLTFPYVGTISYFDHHVLKIEYNFGSGYGYPRYVNVSGNSYTDNNVEIDNFGGDLVARYSVKVVDEFNVSSSYSSSVTTNGQSLWKNNDNSESISKIDTYELKSNYPNPFNPNTLISYQIPKEEFVNLVVYNSIGQEVEVLINKSQPSGIYSVNFRANNLPSGIYIYKLQAGKYSSIKKMMLIK